MEEQTSSQQQPQQCPQSSSIPTSQTTRNIKNLSIKEFFTTRLMRAKSFEGGGNSPKDETPNWFDEFKARMTKKSLANQSAKQNTQGSGVYNITGDNRDEGTDNLASTSELGTNRVLGHFKLGKLYQAASGKDDHSSTIVKDACDNNPLGKLTESTEDVSQGSMDDSEDTVKDASKTPPRAKNKERLSSVDSPDFDTASINTIFNRRDSRYYTGRGSRSYLSVSKLMTNLKRIISHVLPFNYNLPWKLLTMTSLTFVIIVLAVASEASPELMTFNFFSGFISGILVACLCFLIVILSLLTRMLPASSQEAQSTSNISNASIRAKSISFTRTPNVSFIESRSNKPKSTLTSPKSEESYSEIELLGDENRNQDGQDATSRTKAILDDEDYKGWMIEFVGDYEQRNKSEFKLKLMFVKIEERMLHLCKPKNNHDAESATFPVFVQQRTYDLNTAKKFSASLLLPRTVRNRQKWVWSKKYPIRLEFIDESDQVGAAKSSEPGPKTIHLTLFAKSCREKEEWFRRFKRIVDESRITSVQSLKRSSLQSTAASVNDEPLKDGRSHCNSRSISPTPSIRVQTSQSSHLIGDIKKGLNDENLQSQMETTSPMVRTKSCEVLNGDQSTSRESAYDTSERFEDYMKETQPYPDDDSTLTRETANLFSQAIEYSNFIESQPTLDYKDYIERVIESSQEATATSDWFNSLTGRIFFDVFSHNYWSVWFKRKIQRKLYRIRLPYFMETLTLTQIDLGTNAPQFLNVVSHNFDSFGLSIDFDMAYSGGLTMTFETKLNLLKIKADNSSTSSSSNNNTTSGQQSSVNANPTTSYNLTQSNQTIETSTKDASSVSSVSSSDNTGLKDDISAKVNLSSPGSTRTSGESSESDDSDDDSSSDSSYDDADVDEISDWEDYGAEKTRQSILKFVDKIASSRYFQHATENKYIKRKLQDISNCPLVLIVKIESLNGVLTVNVPPPQTNRIWYGFKPNPELTLKALPKMGDREVNLSHVTDWIERKLSEEFRKILVIPNMEDIVLPVLKSDHLLYVTSTK